MNTYTDIENAVRAEKRSIRLGWISGTAILIIIAAATRTVPVLSVITQALLVVGVLALTVALFRMTRALDRKLHRARKDVLGDA